MPAAAVLFRILGTPELVLSDDAVNTGPPKQQVVLASLALSPGRPIAIEELIDRVWQDAPPDRCRQLLATYVSRLRAIFRVSACAVRIDCRSGTYVMRCAEEAIDLFRFRAAVTSAKKCTAAGDDVLAGSWYETAFELWRGTALAGLPGSWALRTARRLEVERRDAQVAWAESLCRLGRHAEAAGHLRRLVDDHPDDEHLVGQLMRALHGAGRTAQALKHFQLLRQRLSEQLGVDPSARLRELYVQLLTESAPRVARSRTI
jgi:DNA-binding SARP family transcriptional activator